MSATNLALPLTVPSIKPAETTAASTSSATGPGPAGPRLCCKPLLRPELPRRFVRVPTHAVGVHPEHREYPRATLKLPLKLKSVDGVMEEFPVTLVTRDISSTGVYFLCPKDLADGAIIELQIVLVGRPLGQGNVVMVSMRMCSGVMPQRCPDGLGLRRRLMMCNLIVTILFRHDFWVCSFLFLE
jgi:PilZ domain.